MGWAEFAPDLSNNNPAYSDAIRNVIPLADGYGAAPSFAQIGAAATSDTPQGGYSARLANNSSVAYVGTATTIERFNAATVSFDDVTRVSGGPYTSGDDWSSDQFGSLLIMVNGVDASQSIDVDSGSNFAALSGAPIASYVRVVGDFVVMGRLSTDKSAVQWSGVNDATYWTSNKRGSDLQTIPSGGQVRGIVPHQDGFIVFMDDEMHMFSKTGGTGVFRRDRINNSIGCFAPFSITSVRNTFYWYANGGFYEGPEANPIGAERVNRYVLSVADPSDLQFMRGAAHPILKTVFFSYKKINGDYEWLGFNWVTRRWSVFDYNLSHLFAMVNTTGATFDTWDDYASTFDTLPGTFNSNIYATTRLSKMGALDVDGNYGALDGTNLAATLETNDFQLNTGGYGFLRWSQLMSDSGVSSVTGRTGTHQTFGDMISWSDSTAADTSDGRVWHQHRGMTHRIRHTIAAGSTWNTTPGCLYEGKAAGYR